MIVSVLPGKVVPKVTILNTTLTNCLGFVPGGERWLVVGDGDSWRGLC